VCQPFYDTLIVGICTLMLADKRVWRPRSIPGPLVSAVGVLGYGYGIDYSQGIIIGVGIIVFIIGLGLTLYRPADESLSNGGGIG
jgi:hypothetical protein